MSEKEYTPVEAAKKVLEKCQEMYNSQKIKKAEMDKCGEMSKGHDEAKESPAQEAKESSAVQAQEEKQDKEMHPKLKRFIEKRKAKKAAKMEKMMGIGEKAPVAAPAQSAAPVNAPKPALPKVGGAMGKSEKKK
jgi:hypothetical protein